MLYLGFNNISTLPDSINKLTNLIALNLSNNKISTLPDSIGKLTKLTVLNLSNNKVSTLPNSIYKLTSLTKLDLSNNEISTLPDFICMLTNLTVLNLGNNKISTLPNSSYGLTNLTKLGLNNNEISTLPDSICTLTNLTILNLSNNKISTLPDAICKLTSLTGLGLNNNEIFTLSDSISKLTNLTELGLNNNEISTLPDSICKLTSLTKLSLYGNEISTLPDSISKLINLTLINLKNNPLETPPLAIVEEGISAIQAFFRDRQNEGILLHEARILIVGEPGAGKTTLMKKLRNPDYKLPEDGEDSTLGIQVEKNWSFPDCNQPSIRFKTHIWDFGGQEIQYMTHQFFLRPRSLYVLVCDNRKQDAEFDYWFKVINLMGKGCPVLVVLNARNYQATTNFDLAYYRDLYPELTIDQYAVDLGKMDDRGRLNHLVAAIQKSVCNLPHIGEKLPEAWIPIREQLEAQKDRHHISYSELAAICAEHGLEREDSVLLVSTYLDALGLIVHFQNDGALHDFVVIDPQWVVNAIYALLDDTTVQNQKGYFSQSWINELWQSKGYSHIERLRFISLMEQDNFELCFAVKDCDEHQYIVPQLLPKVAPQYAWNDDHNLHFRINYPTFMPKGIMARLIVRLNDLLTHEGNRPMIWKLGMLLQAHGCKAAVLHKPDNQLGGESIFIRVAGHALHRKALLMEIRKQLHHIHSRSFKSLNANEYIPCCGSRCSASETPCFFKFTSLITTLENRRSTHYCETCNEDIDIGEMIGSAIVIKEQEDETMSDKIMAGERGHQQTINFSPNISIDSRLISRQTTEVSISIEIQTINAFAGKLGLLKKNLLKGVADPSQKKLLKDTFAEVEASTKTLKKAEETKTKQDESAVMQLQDFVEDLHDADTTLGKAVSSVENGAKHAKKLGQLYNKIASFTGMPVIPLIGS